MPRILVTSTKTLGGIRRARVRGVHIKLSGRDRFDLSMEPLCLLWFAFYGEILVLLS